MTTIQKRSWLHLLAPVPVQMTPSHLVCVSCQTMLAKRVLSLTELSGAQVTKVLQSCFAQLRQLTKIRSFLSSVDLGRLFYAFLSSTSVMHLCCTNEVIVIRIIRLVQKYCASMFPIRCVGEVNTSYAEQMRFSAQCRVTSAVTRLALCARATVNTSTEDLAQQWVRAVVFILRLAHKSQHPPQKWPLLVTKCVLHFTDKWLYMTFTFKRRLSLQRC